MPGKRLSTQAQQLVLNVLKYFEEEKAHGGPLISISAVYERVAAAAGISIRTVQSIKKRKAENPILSSPGKKRPRTKSKTVDLRESSKMDVRNTLYNMYKERKHVTLMTLKDELQSKQIEIGKSSLSLLLKNIGFKFKKEDNRRALMEKFDIACLRASFLRKYMENKNSSFPRPVIFLDETWIYSKGSRGRSWQDDSIESVRKPEGYDGKRFIIVHAGYENGFIEGASLLFASQSRTGDYHGEMNSEKFKQWVTTQLIPNLPERSMIVMDNAPYHSVVTNKTPTTCSRKQEIVEWLQENNIHYLNEMTKMELLQLVRINKPEKIYEIDNILNNHGHIVLRLPPYHCEFNAIELIWAKAKNYYNTNIGRDGYTDGKILNMWNEALQQCDIHLWEECVRHTTKIIEVWYDRERYLSDLDIAPLIINPNESSTESESDLESD